MGKISRNENGNYSEWLIAMYWFYLYEIGIAIAPTLKYKNRTIER